MIIMVKEISGYMYNELSTAARFTNMKKAHAAMRHMASKLDVEYDPDEGTVCDGENTYTLLDLSSLDNIPLDPGKKMLSALVDVDD